MVAEDPNSIRQHIFQIVFSGSSRAARLFDLSVLIAILASVVVVLMDSLPSLGIKWHERLRSAEVVFTLVFTVEYLVRLWCHPRPARYALSFFGIVDFVSIVPTFLALIFPGWENLAVLRVLRVLRIFRAFGLGRFSRASEIIATAITASRYKIAVFIVGVLIAALVGGSLMYMVEGPEREEFRSIPEGFYWAVFHLTTVGHTDISATTPLGKVMSSIIMMLGYCFFAVPVALITSEVISLKKVRDEMLTSGESDVMEYKSSAFFSHQKPDLPEATLFEASVLKPIAGFLNSKGGTLVIGVADDGHVLGIQSDLDLKHWDVDRYVNTLTSKIGTAMGLHAAAMTTISTEPYQGLPICIIEVLQSPDPVYLQTQKNKKVFLVRINNSTRELSGAEMVSYINRRWT